MRLSLILIPVTMLAALSCGPPLDADIETSAGPPVDVVVLQPQQSALTQIITGSGENRWNDDVKLDITYCVDAGFDGHRDRVVVMMAEGTKDWSQDVQVVFRYLPDIVSGCHSSTTARLRVIPGLSYACREAGGGTSYSYLPRTCPDGSPPLFTPNTGGLHTETQTAAIALVFESVTGLSDDLLWIVRHELGHVLGFDHEDGTLGCSSNHRVGSLPLTAPDPNSIMLTSSCNVNPPRTLSALDRQGAGRLYGHVVNSTTSIPGHAMSRGAWFSSVSPTAVGADRTFTAKITGTGDLDLYIGVGFAPTLDRFTAVSRGSTSTETVTATLPPFPFGQDVFVSVFAYSDGVLESWTLSSGRLDNPMDLVSRIGAQTATHSSGLAHPVCTRAGVSCSSGTTLQGRGRMSGGGEANAPNHLDSGCPDGDAGTYGSDESIEAIRVVSADSGPLRSTRFANVTVDLVSWSTTADRLELYYRAEPGGPWFLKGTRNPSAVGRTSVVFPIQLNYGGPVQSVRAVFRYSAQSQSSCPSAIGRFDDIDDLSFTVAPVYAGYTFN